MTENGLKSIFRDTEEEYIQEFCEAFKEEIQTPDGFTVFCKYLRKTAIHICRGQDGKVFQPARAQRILWAKYILMHPNERIVLTNEITGNLLFFLTKERNPHLIVCNKLEEKWNIISSHLVGGKRAKAYLSGKPPYPYYKP